IIFKPASVAIAFFPSVIVVPSVQFISAPHFGQYLKTDFISGSSKNLSHPQFEHLSQFAPSKMPPS
ncbi:hypothetical protein, partial [Ruthenibacterium lactatiformans]|uniref:hypothetical protein n=1 Tax=Ruthenibacterium lactatiformans TaxID=1550024 RepID=UPI003FD89EB2